MNRRPLHLRLLPGVFLLACSLLFASLCVAFQKKGKSPKPPEVTVIEVICKREGGDVQVDGKLKATGERPLKQVDLIVDFLGASKQLLESKRGPVDSEELAPGDETEFHLRVADPIKAVLFTLRAEDSDGRELRVDKAGPFTIE